MPSVDCLRPVGRWYNDSIFHPPFHSSVASDLALSLQDRKDLTMITHPEVEMPVLQVNAHEIWPEITQDI